MSQRSFPANDRNLVASDRRVALMQLKTIQILNSEIACATYDSALCMVCGLARDNRPAAVSASNTHILSAARHDPSFGEVLHQFDLVLPDGMPLVWTMNLAGAKLRDRVYGPYFMRHVIQNTPRPWKHFFFGGTPETLSELSDAARVLQPDIEIVGSFSPPFARWTEEDQEEFAQRIAKNDPDFIWVALGGERQERWIVENQHRFKRGVFFAVGDAFELLAGHRAFAPRWMQRTALTWLYRLWQEPSRLWKRYLKYNFLYLTYLGIDGLHGRAIRRTANSPLRIVFFGSRGVPARYSGFETVVEELGARLAGRGHSVTVYNRPYYYPDRPRHYRGMRLVYIPTIMRKSFETILHTVLSFLHAFVHRYDLIYLCGVGNAPLAWIGRLRSWKMIINTDGIDYRRRKWGRFARWWLRQSERMAVLFANRVVVDNREVEKHYERRHHFTPVCIPYGAPAPEDSEDESLFAQFQVKPHEYILYVSRLTPENDAALLLEAYRQLKNKLPLIVVGPVGYETNYKRELDRLASPGVIFAGPIYGEGYRTLSRHCRFFVLPSAIEATRLVLLDQMGFGNAVIYRDVPATREVIGEAGEPFEPTNMVGSLREKMAELIANPEKCRELGRRALERANKLFNWESVTDRYERLFYEVCLPKTTLESPAPRPSANTGARAVSREEESVTSGR